MNSERMIELGALDSLAGDLNDAMDSLDVRMSYCDCSMPLTQLKQELWGSFPMLCKEYQSLTERQKVYVWKSFLASGIRAQIGGYH